MRLRPLTNDIPKCLVPINGVPLLDYWFNLLLPNGIDEILINTHYLPDAVIRHITNSAWRKRISLVHEPHLLGTAGTILGNEHFFGGRSFFVAHADNLTLFNVESFLQAHADRANGVEATVMTFETDAPHLCGIIEQNNQRIITAMHEKSSNPPGTLANGAIYVFEPSVISIMHAIGKKELDLSTEVLPKLLGRMQSYHNDYYLRDIGNINSLRLAEQEFPSALSMMKTNRLI